MLNGVNLNASLSASVSRRGQNPLPSSLLFNIVVQDPDSSKGQKSHTYHTERSKTLFADDTTATQKILRHLSTKKLLELRSEFSKITRNKAWPFPQSGHNSISSPTGFSLGDQSTPASRDGVRLCSLNLGRRVTASANRVQCRWCSGTSEAQPQKMQLTPCLLAVLLEAQNH